VCFSLLTAANNLSLSVFYSHGRRRGLSCWGGITSRGLLNIYKTIWGLYFLRVRQLRSQLPVQIRPRRAHKAGRDKSVWGDSAARSAWGRVCPPKRMAGGVAGWWGETTWQKPPLLIPFSWGQLGLFPAPVLWTTASIPSAAEPNHAPATTAGNICMQINRSVRQSSADIRTTYFHFGIHSFYIWLKHWLKGIHVLDQPSGLRPIV